MRRFLPVVVVGASLVLGATVFRSEVASAAQQALQVFVTNDALNPVPVHEQGTVVIRDPESAREPWHMFLGPNDVYVVPDGKRLVIEYVNGIAQLFGSTQPDWTLSIVEATGGQGYHFIGSSLFNCTDCYAMSQQVRLYAPAGSSVRVGTVPIGSVLRVSGYLIDVR